MNLLNLVCIPTVFLCFPKFEFWSLKMSFKLANDKDLYFKITFLWNLIVQFWSLIQASVHFSYDKWQDRWYSISTVFLCYQNVVKFLVTYKQHSFFSLTIFISSFVKHWITFIAVFSTLPLHFYSILCNNFEA